MIEVQDLGKRFRERRGQFVEAVRGVTFQCRPGEVFGLLGPNGAGKTTTLRILSTALRPSAGSAAVAGCDVVREAADVRRRIGFLSTATALYGRLTPREQLRYFGELYGLTREHIAHRTEELAETLDMAGYLDRRCDDLSTGMKQRVGIARAVIHDPPVMILDEPTIGLDVLGARDVVAFIRRCRSEGKTVLLSTHIMGEAQALCDRLAVIHEGRIVFSGTMDEVVATHGDDLEAAFLALVGAEEAGA